MYRYAIPFPTAPGKTESDIRSIAASNSAHPAEYLESRRRLGVTLERAYVQATPMGIATIAYLESDRDFASSILLLTGSDLEFDRRFLDMVAAVHGVDMRQPPPGPPPETVGSWNDPSVTDRRRGLAFIAPLLPGKVDATSAFSRHAYHERAEELAESRRALGVTVEVITLNSNPMGDFVCAYIEGADPVDANRRFASSTRSYDLWFRGRLKELFPPEVDFDRPVPPVAEVFDSLAVHATA
ncbi:MAG TPA: hypothetical protein VOB72_12255 [Candidatus Dormibacteraeota bacterium]|nr:hypothetical protein [Candidatus Dormibacteraeota bacterium]